MGLRSWLGLRAQDKALPDWMVGSPQSIEDIKNARKNLKTLAPLRSHLRELVGDRRCFVVGSAPQATRTDYDICICVNGSGWSAARLGIDCPDLTIIGGWTLRGDTPVRSETIEAIRGLRTKEVLLVEFGISLEEGRNVLERAGFHFDRLLTVNAFDRAVVIGDVCGEEIPVGPKTFEKRPSMGLTAVAFALWGGCRDVTMTGFSLSGGHAYMTGDTPRLHVEGDKWFLERAKHLPIKML